MQTIEEQVHAAQIRAGYRSLPVATIVAAINAALFTAALVSVEGDVRAFVWLAAVFALAGIRGVAWWAFRHASDEARQARDWTQLAVAGAVASGFLWGLGAIWLWPETQTLQVLWIFLVGGMCAGAAVVSSTHWPTAVGFILSAGVPLVVKLVSEPALGWIPAVMPVIFIAVLSVMSREYSRKFTDMTRLNLALTARSRDLDTVNRRLRREIDGHRETEAMLRQAGKMKDVGNLTAGIAHDFNNILGVVIGNLDILRDSPGTDAEDRKLAQSALDAALRGAALIARLMAFSREQPLAPEAFDPGEALRAAEPLLRRALGESIVLDMEPAADVWPVLADPNQFDSALLNLAINARDAMPKGGTLSIGCGNLTVDDSGVAPAGLRPGDYVAIEMRDTGSGIAADDLPHVFEPFFTTKGATGGTGLGLGMVKGYAEQSGGAITLQSEVDKGTAVRLYLRRAQNGDVRDMTPTAEKSGQTGHDRILVVDDQEEVRQAAVRLLRALGHTTVEADHASAALEILEQGEHFDLLFTDIVMPGAMNGVDLALEVRRRRPELPILFTSGFVEPEIIQGQAGHLGAELLRKPYGKAELARMLDRLLVH